MLSFLAVTVATLITACRAQGPLICEDSISGQAPFDSVDVPCLLRCGDSVSMATGSLLPGSVNSTNIPYCELDCVRKEATPAQSSAAPACDQQCRQRNSGTPEQLGWCMYWCVQGGNIAQSVVATTCVPSLEYVPVATSTIDGDFTVTVQGMLLTPPLMHGSPLIPKGFTQPPEWASWYQTQTAIPRTSQIMFASTSMPMTSMSTATVETTTKASTRPSQTSSPALMAHSMQSTGDTEVTGLAETQRASSQSPTSASKSGANSFSPWIGGSSMLALIFLNALVIDL